MSEKTKLEDVFSDEEYNPTHNMKGNYVVLMETNDKEIESWYYFIRYEGNEKMLENLQKQLEMVNWYMLDELSTFDLDLEHFVSAITAKQMTKLELNSHSFHRKFDGKLKEIDFKFRSSDDNESRMEKVYDILSYGQIDDFVDDEDIDKEDLTDYKSSDDDNSYTEEDTEDEKEDTQKQDKRVKGIPKSLLKDNSTPKWAKARRKNRRN